MGCFYLESGDGEPLVSAPVDERAAFDMSDAEWCDVFEQIQKTVPNVFGSYAKVLAKFAREAIRIAATARAAASPAAEGEQALEDNPLYTVRMSAIISAACGYWNPADTIKPEYKTPALDKVAALYRQNARSLVIIRDLREELDSLKNSTAEIAADLPFHKLLAALIDIYDDERNNAPEDRCYVEGAWTEVVDEARATLLAAPQPAQADAPAEAREPHFIAKLDFGEGLVVVQECTLDDAPSIAIYESLRQGTPGESAKAEPSPTDHEIARRSVFLTFLDSAHRDRVADALVGVSADAGEAVAIHQCMATDGDEAEHDQHGRDLWMDVPSDAYEKLSKRPDVRSRIVYTAPPTARVASLPAEHIAELKRMDADPTLYDSERLAIRAVFALLNGADQS
ncbi:hypothetical protein WJ63_15810 [Burkholderia pyrrocinia]|nr:hypothetical protein WJ63_15810 [Burkholderia pyrrocinia]